MNYEDFLKTFINILNQHALKKQKLVRKALSKAMMLSSELKNVFNKYATEENNRLYKKQRDYCVNLLKKEKKKHYNNLDLKIFNDNKTFWQRIKPLFSDNKSTLQRNIIIIEDNFVYTDKMEVSEKLNYFFVEAVDYLEIKPFAVVCENDISENITEIVKMYESHPSVLKIKENIRYRGPKTWEILPSDIKKAKSLVEFKAKIKKWKPQGCTCRLCLNYVYHYGFISILRLLISFFISICYGWVWRNGRRVCMCQFNEGWVWGKGRRVYMCQFNEGWVWENGRRVCMCQFNEGWEWGNTRRVYVSI